MKRSLASFLLLLAFLGSAGAESFALDAQGELLDAPFRMQLYYSQRIKAVAAGDMSAAGKTMGDWAATVVILGIDGSPIGYYCSQKSFDDIKPGKELISFDPLLLAPGAEYFTNLSFWLSKNEGGSYVIDFYQSKPLKPGMSMPVDFESSGTLKCIAYPWEG
jgi:hypothetical protein